MKISFVVCVSDKEVLESNLLRSPCVQRSSTHQLICITDCTSAAQGFEYGLIQASGNILCFVHQDVFLPQGWDERFLQGVLSVRKLFGAEVIGVYGYGVDTEGNRPRPCGEIIDRGEMLKGECCLPCRAHSLDELLFAVPLPSRLRLDESLGFDLYATDLVLQVEAAGSCGAIIWAPCEHHSSLPRKDIPLAVLQRFQTASKVFEKKWAHRFPVRTSCVRFTAEKPVSAEIERMIKNQVFKRYTAD